MTHKTSIRLTLLLPLLLLFTAHAGAAARRQQQPQSEPRDASGFFARAVERHRAGRLEEALASFTEVIRLRPELHDPYAKQAAMYALLRRR